MREESFAEVVKLTRPDGKVSAAAALSATDPSRPALKNSLILVQNPRKDTCQAVIHQLPLLPYVILPRTHLGESK